MKFIDQSFEYIDQMPGIDGMYLQIEKAGRTCYKSIGTRYFKIPLTGGNVPSNIDEIVGVAIVHVETSYVKTYGKYARTWMCLSLLQREIKDYPTNITLYEIDEETALNHPEEAFKNRTARNFAEDVLKKNGHYAMLEHGTVFLTVPCYRLDILSHYVIDKYSRLKYKDGNWLITTNYRVVSEKNVEDDMLYFSTDTTYHHKKHTVRFIMDRIGSQSVCRHRGKYGVSFAQESTRYVDFDNEKKVGTDIKFVIPQWVYRLRDSFSETIDPLTGFTRDDLKGLEGDEMVRRMSCVSRAVAAWFDSCERCEQDYKYLRAEECLKPEDARDVLNFSLATNVVVTAFEYDWKHFFELRDESHAHPNIQWLAKRLHNDSHFMYL